MSDETTASMWSAGPCAAAAAQPTAVSAMAPMSRRMFLSLLAPREPELNAPRGIMRQRAEHLRCRTQDVCRGANEPGEHAPKCFQSGAWTTTGIDGVRLWDTQSHQRPGQRA